MSTYALFDEVAIKNMRNGLFFSYFSLSLNTFMSCSAEVSTVDCIKKKSSHIALPANLTLSDLQTHLQQTTIENNVAKEKLLINNKI